MNSIYVALSGRIFEGLASDNLLHFTLNAVYAQSRRKEKTSSLISYSLALYMIGISVSPFVAGLFQNFTISFFIALALFALSITYLQLCLTRRASKIIMETSIADESQRRHGNGHLDDNGFAGSLKRWSSTIFSPLGPFRRHPVHLFVGLSLFVYNVIQSYIFNALLIHTSVRFGFTGRENGFIISIAHSIAALYIFASLYLIPRMWQYFQKEEALQTSQTQSGPRNKDVILALVSLTVQTLSLMALGFARQAWQIYCITVLLAIGLPTPSFIKGYFVSLYEGVGRPEALAALTMMETLGSVIGPLLLGGAQSYFAAGGGVFFTAAGLGGTCFVLLSVGSFRLSHKTILYDEPGQ